MSPAKVPTRRFLISGMLPLYLDPPAAELSAERPRRQKLPPKSPKTPPARKHAETQQTLRHAETCFREIPPISLRIPPISRRIPPISCCLFCTELDFEKKTLPGKLKTPPTAKRRLFPKRQKLLPIWVVQVYQVFIQSCTSAETGHISCSPGVQPELAHEGPLLVRCWGSCPYTGDMSLVGSSGDPI